MTQRASGRRNPLPTRNSYSKLLGNTLESRSPYLRGGGPGGAQRRPAGWPTGGTPRVPSRAPPSPAAPSPGAR